MQIIQICNPAIPDSYRQKMLRTKAIADAACLPYRIEGIPDCDSAYDMAVAAELLKLEILAVTRDAFIIDADDELFRVPDFPLTGRPYFDYLGGHPTGGTIYCNGMCDVFKPLIDRYKDYMYFGAMRRKILWDIPGYEIDRDCHKHYFNLHGRKK